MDRMPRRSATECYRTPSSSGRCRCPCPRPPPPPAAAGADGGTLRFRVIADVEEWALRHEVIGGALFAQGRAASMPDVGRSLCPWQVRRGDVREGLQSFVELMCRIGAGAGAGCVGPGIAGLAADLPLAGLLPRGSAQCEAATTGFAGAATAVCAAWLARWEEALELHKGDPNKAAAMLYSCTVGSQQRPMVELSRLYPGKIQLLRDDDEVCKPMAECYNDDNQAQGTAELSHRHSFWGFETT